MCLNPSSPSDSTQHPGHVHEGAVPEQQPESPPIPDNTITPISPFVHPLMVPQFHPFYWPHFLNLHPMQNSFSYFPISPHLQVCPFHAAAWYHFQQAMMGTYLYARQMPLVNPTSTSQSPIAQSTETSPATSITNNFVTFNEIGNDNSTNLKIKKNRHQNTGSD